MWLMATSFKQIALPQLRRFHLNLLQSSVEFHFMQSEILDDFM